MFSVETLLQRHKPGGRWDTGPFGKGVLELCGLHDEAGRWGFGGNCTKTGENIAVKRLLQVDCGEPGW